VRAGQIRPEKSGLSESSHLGQEPETSSRLMNEWRAAADEDRKPSRTLLPAFGGAAFCHLFQPCTKTDPLTFALVLTLSGPLTTALAPARKLD
jgi:hypothetical protein